MRSNRFLSIIVIAVLAFGVAGCSKDKKIEKQLQKKGGVWNIDKIEWTDVEQTTMPPSQIVLQGTTNNAGTFTFKDGDASYNYTAAGETGSGTFSYSVESEEITIIYVFQNTIGSIYQETAVYTGEKVSKDEYFLTGSETYQDSSGQTVFTGEFTITR